MSRMYLSFAVSRNRAFMVVRCAVGPTLWFGVCQYVQVSSPRSSDQRAVFRLMDAVGSGEVAEYTGLPAIPAEAIRRLCLRRSPAADPAAAPKVTVDVDPRGIHIRGARITGILDLRGLSIEFPVRFDHCIFDQAPLLAGAEVAELRFVRCELPGLSANGLCVQRDLDLSGSQVRGVLATSASVTRQASIWLCEASIGGRLLAIDTTIEAAGGRAIQADQLQVTGTVRLVLTARGQVRLLGACLASALDLTGLQITDPLDGVALDLSDARIAGALFLLADFERNVQLAGRLDARGMSVGGDAVIRGVQMTTATPEPNSGSTGSLYSSLRRSGTAINAPRLKVDGVLAFEGSCVITGGVDVSLSRLGELSLSARTRVQAPGATALDLTNALVRSEATFQPGLQMRGSLVVTGAHIRGRWVMNGTSWQEPNGQHLIAAQGVRVDGDVILHELHVTGGKVNFRSAVIAGSLELLGAQISNPAGEYSLGFNQATIQGSLTMTYGFANHGVVMIRRASMGRLELTDGSFVCPQPVGFRNPDGHALIIMGSTVQAAMNVRWRTVSPSVDFTDTTTAILVDDPQRWPQGSVIAGLTYGRFAEVPGAQPRWDADARLQWLRRQAGFEAGPYEQAARVYREQGYADAAEDLLIAQRADARRADRVRRRTMLGGPRVIRPRLWGWLGDIWEWLLRVLVGHGYRPGRVVWILAALMVMVAASLHVPAVYNLMRSTDQQAVVYGVHGPLGAPVPVDTPGTSVDRCGKGAVRCFDPEFYAIDSVIPLISLGQRTAWYADEGQPGGRLLTWWLNLATMVGWLLSSVFVLSFTRLARS